MFDFILPEIQSTERVFDSRYMKIDREQLRLANESLYDYFSLSLGPAVMVLACDEKGRFLITREYRHPPRQVLLALPGGLIDANEEPITAAKRELLEETGHSALAWSPLREAYPMPGMSGQIIHYFKAMQTHFVQKPSLEPTEFIESMWLTKQEIKSLILQGAPVDGILLTALFLNSLIEPV